MKPNHFQKILIIATRQIGDTLITTPLIERTHSIWPNASIDFLGFSNSVGVLDGNPYLNAIIGTSKKPKLQEYLQLFKKIFMQYDLAIITQPSDRAYLYGLFAANKRVGVCHPGVEDHGWKKWITMHQVAIDYFSQHVVLEKLKLLDPFISNDQKLPPINIVPPRFDSLPPELQDISHPFVVIHPSPLNTYKCWPIASWVKLIEYAVQQDLLVVMSGGPDINDHLISKNILQNLSPKTQQMLVNLTGKLDFGALAKVLHHARAYIGVDTAITHLAAACHTPTIALFGPTPPTNFGPWPNGSLEQPYQLRAAQQTVENITILQGPGDCVPCRKAGCDDQADSRSICLEELTSDRVIKALQEILDRD
jgi:heptosyltransferase III